MQIASLMILAFAWNAEVLLLATSLYGVSSAAFLPISTSVSLSKASIGDRGTVMGKYFTATGISMLLGPLLIGFIIACTSFRVTIAFLILFPVSGLILLATCILKKQVFPSFRNNRVGVKGSLRGVFTESNITVLLIIHLVFLASLTIFNTLFPIYATQSLNYSSSSVSIFFAVRGGCNFFLRGPSGAMSDRIGRKKLLTTTFLLALTSYCLFIFVRDVVSIVIAMALLGVAWGIQLPLISAAIGDRMPIDLIPVAMAIFYMAESTGHMIGPLIAGFVGGRYAWETIITPQALIMIVSAILVKQIFKEK